MFHHPSTTQPYPTQLFPIFYQVPQQNNGFQVYQNMPQQQFQYPVQQQIPFVLCEQPNIYNNGYQMSSPAPLYNHIAVTQPILKMNPLQVCQSNTINGQVISNFNGQFANPYHQVLYPSNPLINLDCNENIHLAKIPSRQEFLQAELMLNESNLKLAHSPSSYSSKEIQEVSTQIMEGNPSLTNSNNQFYHQDNCNKYSLSSQVNESNNFKKRTNPSKSNKINENLTIIIQKKSQEMRGVNQQLSQEQIASQSSNTNICLYRPSNQCQQGNERIDTDDLASDPIKINQKQSEQMNTIDIQEEKLILEKKKTPRQAMKKPSGEKQLKNKKNKVQSKQKVASIAEDICVTKENFDLDEEKCIENMNSEDDGENKQDNKSDYVRQSKKKLIKQPEALEQAKHLEEQAKIQLIEKLDSSQREILRSAIQTNRQNINRNFIKQFKQFVNQKISYTLNYQKSSEQNYQFKSCKNLPISCNFNPSPQEKLSFSKKFNKFIASKHHSNNDIKQIIENKIYGYLFQEFLTTDIDEWVEQNIDERKSDYRCIIKFYLLCCSQNKYLNFMNDSFSLNRKNIFYFKQCDSSIPEHIDQSIVAKYELAEDCADINNQDTFGSDDDQKSICLTKQSTQNNQIQSRFDKNQDELSQTLLNSSSNESAIHIETLL